VKQSGEKNMKKRGGFSAPAKTRQLPQSFTGAGFWKRQRHDIF